jgi:hypothetical protein
MYRHVVRSLISLAMRKEDDDSELNSSTDDYSLDDSKSIDTNDDQSSQTPPPRAIYSSKNLTKALRIRLFQDIEAEGGWENIEKFNRPPYKDLSAKVRDTLSKKLYRLKNNGKHKYLAELQQLRVTKLGTSGKKALPKDTVQATPSSNKQPNMPPTSARKKLCFDDDPDDGFEEVVTDRDGQRLLIDSNGERLFNVIDGKSALHLHEAWIRDR